MTKKVLSVILVLAMVCSLIPVVSAKTEDKFQLVVFGDSCTNGYGLHGYADERAYNWTGTAEEYTDWYANGKNAAAWNPHDRFVYNLTGYRTVVEGSTADDIADLLREQGEDVELHQLAISGGRVEELRVLLDNDYYGDEYTEAQYTMGSAWFDNDGGVEALRKDYQDTTGDADLIVIDIGANNFGTYIAWQLINNAFGNDFANIYGEEKAQAFYDARAKIESAMVKLGNGSLNEETFAGIDSILDTIAYSVAGFCENFNAVIERIRVLNSEADIVATSIPNTLAGMNVTIEGLPVPLGEIMAIPIDMANAYMAALCPNISEYKFADFCSETGRTEIYLDRLIGYNGDSSTIDQNMRDCVNIYDDWTFMLEYMTANMGYAGVAKGTDAYYAGLEAGYDSIMRMMQAIVLDEDVKFDLTADLSESGSLWYNKIINDSIYAAVMSAKGQDYLPFIESEIEKLYSDELVKLSGALYVRTVIGNGFFAHPTYEASYTKAKTIIDVYNNTVSRLEVLCNALENQKLLWEKVGIKYGAKFGIIFVDELAKKFGLKNYSGAVLTQLTIGDDFDALIESLLKETKVDNDTFIKKFTAALNDAEAKVSKPKSTGSVLIGKIAGYIRQSSFLSNLFR